MTEIAQEKPKYLPGSIGELLVIALPMMASHACDTVMTFTDRLFLSKVGTAQMNAALGGGLSAFMITTFFLGLIGYSTALVAQYYGSGQKLKCPVAITQAVIVAILAYPIILMLSPLMKGFFASSGIAPEQLAPQTLYFSILIYASVISLLRAVFSSFFSGIGRTRVVMLSSIVAMVVNIGANYVLIFGKFGFPALGIKGAAYGTILGGVCALLVMVWAYFSGRTFSEYGVGRSFHFDWDVMRKLLKFGYPAGLEFFLNLAAFTFMITLFHAQGQAVATAATVTFNWDMVTFLPLIGVEIAVTSLVGRYMGARQPDTAHTATMSGIKVGWIYSTVMLVMFVAFPGALVNVFRPEVNDAVFVEALPLTLFMVRLVALYVMIEAVVIAFSGALRGAGDTFWAMCISVSLHWMLVGILYVLFNIFHASAQLAWVMLITWFMIFSLLYYLRYRSGKWKEIKVVGDGEVELQPAHEGVGV